MKSLFKSSIFAIFAMVFASSCTSYYYQIGEIKSIDKNISFKEDVGHIYTDNNISITYSFWGKYGEIYFTINNTSEKDITIHLDNSYFIRNGIAYDYFQNRIYSNTLSKTEGNASALFGHYIRVMNSSSESNANSTTYIEMPKLIIPAKSSKIVSQFNIVEEMYRSCDLYLWQNTLPSARVNREALEDNSFKITFDDKGRTLNKVFFSTETTPCLFENRITYSVEDSEEKIEVVNKFYVESIQNCSENKVKKYEYQKACNNDIEQQVLVNLIYAPNRYYIKYSNNDFKTLH